MYSRNFGSLVVVCLVALALGATNVADKVKPSGSRIVNGNVISIHQAPYIVQIRYVGTGPFCGGTLVAPQFVVSAAHCFESVAPEQLVVVGGANTRYDTGVQRRVVVIVKHSLYTRTTMDADVAILKLESPMRGADIIPVPLCSTMLRPNELVQVSGWGHTSSGGAGSEYLNTIRIPMISREQCQASYGAFPITKYMQCALSHNQDSCQGDSGGPVVIAGELCGIVSCGSGCAEGVPGIYTNVFELRQFIQNTIQTM